MLKVSGTLDSGGGSGSYDGAIVNGGRLVFDQSGAQNLGGVISGGGELVKSGSGTLTLDAVNTLDGETTIFGGVLALGANDSLADSILLIGASGEFDITQATGSQTVVAKKVVPGAKLTTGTNALDLTNGRSLAFDLAGVVAGGTALTVSGVGLAIDTNTNLSASNLFDALKKGDTITLATVASGSVSGDMQQSGRKKYIFELDLGALLLRLAGISSFVDATNDYLGPLASGNRNIQNGGAYLDWLLTQPYANSPGMKALEDYFTNITDKLPPSAGNLELQRLYGAYSAYANQALSIDANRFRRRWQQQNHFFLNGFVFSDLLADITGAGVASASGLASPVYGARQCVPSGQSRVWAGGFGSWAKQDDRSGFAGYKYDSFGVMLGYDYTRDRLRLGVAAAYSRGALKVKDLGYENKPDVANLALYGAYVHESGFYAEGGLGYGHAWNDYDARTILGGRKSGDYGSDVFSADFELGYLARLGCGYNLIPSAGLEYDYIRNDSWAEKVSGNPGLPANRFASGHDHALDIPVGLRANKAFAFGNGNAVIPEVRVSYVYAANKSTPTIQSGFAGAPGATTMRGVDPGRSHWRFGAGVSGQINRRVDFHVEYEFETRSAFKGHNLNASIGVSF